MKYYVRFLLIRNIFQLIAILLARAWSFKWGWTTSKPKEKNKEEKKERPIIKREEKGVGATATMWRDC